MALASAPTSRSAGLLRILWSRQAMLPVRHRLDPRPVASEVGGEIQRMLPGHVRIEQAAQDRI